MSDHDGLVPLQQCVQWPLEKCNTVPADSWVRDPNSLLNLEYGIVSALLEREYNQAQVAKNARLDGQAPKIHPPWYFQTEAPMKHFLNICMKAGGKGLMFDVPRKGHLEYLSQTCGRLKISPDTCYVVVFVGRVRSLW